MDINQIILEGPKWDRAKGIISKAPGKAWDTSKTAYGYGKKKIETGNAKPVNTNMTAAVGGVAAGGAGGYFLGSLGKDVLREKIKSAQDLAAVKAIEYKHMSDELMRLKKEAPKSEDPESIIADIFGIIGAGGGAIAGGIATGVGIKKYLQYRKNKN